MYQPYRIVKITNFKIYNRKISNEYDSIYKLFRFCILLTKLFWLNKHKNKKNIIMVRSVFSLAIIDITIIITLSQQFLIFFA